jgi:hypothetical protein
MDYFIIASFRLNYVKMLFPGAVLLSVFKRRHAHGFSEHPREIERVVNAPFVAYHVDFHSGRNKQMACPLNLHLVDESQRTQPGLLLEFS